MTVRLNPEALDQQALEAAAKALEPGLHGDFERSLVEHAGFSEEKACEYVEAKKRRNVERAHAAVSEYLAALPRAVETVEEIPATIQVISWEEEPEHECWKLSPDETFVGLIVKSERPWSPADQYVLRIERKPTEDGRV